jgi:hypothetical protein
MSVVDPVLFILGSPSPESMDYMLSLRESLKPFQYDPLVREEGDNLEFAQSVTLAVATTLAGGIAQAGLGTLRRVGRTAPMAAQLPGQFRRTKNIGPFTKLQVPMQKRFVENIAEQAGVGLEGIQVRIARDPELVGRGVYGHADPNGKITLYPDAFTNTETLVKTLGHERTHLMQFRLHGSPKDLVEGALNEKAAFGIEETFWRFFLQQGGRP